MRKATKRLISVASLTGVALTTAVPGSNVRAEAPPKSPGTELAVDAQVPADTYLIGNVTAINTPPATGFVSVFGDTFTGTSTVNTAGSDVLPNAFIADPGADGNIGVRIGGVSPRHVVIDSVAELSKNPNTTIFASPRRIKDTREDREAVTAGSTITVNVGSQYAGQFALINLTVDRNNGPGFQATYPCADGYQGTSSINVKGTGGAQAILNLVKVDPAGNICIRAQKAAFGTIVDLLGVIDSDANPFKRLIDTRQAGGPLQPGVERRVVVGEPNSVFIGTIVSTNPTGRGWVAAYTNADGYTGTSTLNSNGINSVANLVVMRTDANGAIHLLTKSNPSGLTTDIVIDGTTIPELAPHLTANPTRLRDTRNDTTGTTNPICADGNLDRPIPAAIEELVLDPPPPTVVYATYCQGHYILVDYNPWGAEASFLALINIVNDDRVAMGVGYGDPSRPCISDVVSQPMAVNYFANNVWSSDCPVG